MDNKQAIDLIAISPLPAQENQIESGKIVLQNQSCRIKGFYCFLAISTTRILMLNLLGKKYLYQVENLKTSDSINQLFLKNEKGKNC